MFFYFSNESFSLRKKMFKIPFFPIRLDPVHYLTGSGPLFDRIRLFQKAGFGQMSWIRFINPARTEIFSPDLQQRFEFVVFRESKIVKTKCLNVYWVNSCLGEAEWLSAVCLPGVEDLHVLHTRGRLHICKVHGEFWNFWKIFVNF